MTKATTGKNYTHHVKCRRKVKNSVTNQTRWYFVTPDLKLTNLRVRAAMFEEAEALASAEAWNAQDPEYEFKAQGIKR